MKVNASNSSMVALFAASFLLLSCYAAPMHESEEEPAESALNTLVGRDAGEADIGGGWDAIDTAALRKLLMQLDAEERGMSRVARSWPAAEVRGWSARGPERLQRPWRADKRQVRFRQCYFNPISCFRK